MPVKICKYLKPLILGFDNFKKSNGYCTVHGRSFFISQKKIVWFIWHFFKKKSLGHVYTQICTGIMRNHRSLTLFVNIVQISCQYCFFLLERNSLRGGEFFKVTTIHLILNKNGPGKPIQFSSHPCCFT